MTYPHQTTKVVQFSRPRILGLLEVSFGFYRQHFLPLLLALMGVAAFGRAFQMGAAGEISSAAYLLLEISTELSRVLLLIFVLGQGSLKVGLRRCLRVFTIKKTERKQVWQRMGQRLRACWPALLWNLIVFGMLAFVTNYSINWLAHKGQVLLELKALHLLAPTATATPVVFFLKNLTVIPFTIVFECSILLWLVGKVEKYPFLRETNMNFDPKNFQKAFVIKPLFGTYIPIASVAIFIVAILALHLFQSDRSILNEAISYYVHGKQGWLFIIGVLSLGVGSLSLTFVLNKLVNENYGKTGIVLLFMWSFGVIAGAIFPIDPPGSWNKPPSLLGMIHGIVALLAFVSFPFAALLISRSLNSYKGVTSVGTAVNFVFRFISCLHPTCVYFPWAT